MLRAFAPITSTSRNRTIISRAYYAAYHAAFDAAAERNVKIVESKGGMHRQLLNSLRASEDDLMRRVGKRLEKIYDRRLTADYQLGQYVTAMMANDAVEDAQEVVYDMLVFEELAAKAQSD